jgi:hypothetical protein
MRDIEEGFKTAETQEEESGLTRPEVVEAFIRRRRGGY